MFLIQQYYVVYLVCHKLNIISYIVIILDGIIYSSVLFGWL